MLKLELLTPQKKILEKEVEWVTLPGVEGEMCILEDHIPLITSLDSGILKFKDRQKINFFAVHWGYANVNNNIVSILAHFAESSNEIDIKRAKLAESKAYENLSGKKNNENWESEKKRIQKYELKLKRALIRQQLAGLNQ